MFVLQEIVLSSQIFCHLSYLSIILIILNVSNCDPPTYPDGFDLEVFSAKALILADQYCTDNKLREHVTPWMRASSLMSTYNLVNSTDLSHIRLTVDEPEDLIVANKIVSALGPGSTINLDIFVVIAIRNCFLSTTLKGMKVHL